MNRLALFPILYLSIIISCSHNSKVDVWEDDLQERFDKGMKYLEKKKYFKAQEELNYVLIRGSHTDLADDALFYLGESYYLNKEYLLAINNFDRLSRQMIYSPYVEQARFRICQGYVTLSPKYYHDQKYTNNAIDKLQEFVEDFPQSEFINEANQLIQEMRNKLARKIYEAGILYIKMEEYSSALLYFEDLLLKYYDTKWADASRLKIVEVYLKMGDGKNAKEYLEKYSDKFRDAEMLQSAKLRITSHSKENRDSSQ